MDISLGAFQQPMRREHNDLEYRTNFLLLLLMLSLFHSNNQHIHQFKKQKSHVYLVSKALHKHESHK